MAIAYTNVQRTRNISEFVESATYSGAAVTCSSKQMSVKKNSVSTQICHGKLSYTSPFTVVNGDSSAEFSGSFSLAFNVERGDVAALEAMHAEVDRLFTVVKRDMAHGNVPSALPASE